MNSSLHIQRLLRFSPREVPGFSLNRVPSRPPRARSWRRLIGAAKGHMQLGHSIAERINGSAIYARMQSAARPLADQFNGLERTATAGLALALGMMAAMIGVNQAYVPLVRAPLEQNPTVVVDRSPTDTAAGEQLTARFAGLDYALPAVATGDMDVPRIYVSNLPPNMARMTTDARKALFIRTLLPLVLKLNEAILADRQRLIRLGDQAAAGVPLDSADADWMAVLAEVYRVMPSDRTTLLARVDMVPPSLAVAQGAEESGWGTSRFAVLGNALFGQWTHVKGAGIVPESRDNGASHEIKTFDALEGSVAGYIRNLNTHPAYGELRAARANMRRTGDSLNGMALAGMLTRYSERGEEYVRSLRTIIRANNLSALDGASLRPALTAAL